MRRNLVLGFLVSFSCAAALLIACVGDEPATGAGSNDDAAASDATVDDSASDGGNTLADGATISVLQVAAGVDNACALLSDGTVWCWGDNTLGESGQVITNKGQPQAQKVIGLSDVIQVSVGGASACALEKDGTVWCWGRNNQLELGAAHSSDQDCSGGACNPMPEQVPGVTALQISVGQNMACAIDPSQQVTCWGANGAGQCGVSADGGGAGVGPSSPTFPGSVKAKRIQLSYDNLTTCMLDTTNQVWCWGLNDKGQLGHSPGSPGDKIGPLGYFDETPHLITQDGGATFNGVIDLISSQTVCVVRNTGTVWCWGRNDGDQLNLGHADDSAHFLPAQINGVSGATTVSGGEALCALVNGGAIACWGGDQVAEGNGQLIDGGGCLQLGDEAGAPCYGVGIVPAPPFSSINVFAEVALGVALDGGAFGWGHNDTVGRIGHDAGGAGDDVNLYNGTPTPVIGLPSNSRANPIGVSFVRSDRWIHGECNLFDHVKFGYTTVV